MIRLLLGTVRALASIPRRHRCGRGCEFRSHDINLMAAHYETNHAGEPLPTKEHAR